MLRPLSAQPQRPAAEAPEIAVHGEVPQPEPRLRHPPRDGPKEGEPLGPDGRRKIRSRCVAALRNPGLQVRGEPAGQWRLPGRPDRVEGPVVGGAGDPAAGLQPRRERRPCKARQMRDHGGIRRSEVLGIPPVDRGHDQGVALETHRPRMIDIDAGRLVEGGLETRPSPGPARQVRTAEGGAVDRIVNAGVPPGRGEVCRTRREEAGSMISRKVGTTAGSATCHSTVRPWAVLFCRRA